MKKKNGIIIGIMMLVVLSLCGCGKKAEIVSQKSEYRDFINQSEAYLEKCQFQGSILVAQGFITVF